MVRRGERVLLVPHVLVRDTIDLLAVDGVEARDLLGPVNASTVAEEMAAQLVADLQQSRRNSE